ncbi:cytotoxic and regulatory T-cell molecule [Cyrtonyx montezumae]|uniref:cytotoxic and regulatory T-cell molecule n=1 Tax=Cyrtonyx montezumae TaxID=9017 RepID=UPI0032DA4C76
MTFTTVLHVTALLLLQGDFPGAASETVILQEGEDLNLHCTLSDDSRAARQWLNPRGFAIFLNNHRALRDQRYKLIHYSEDELSIRLSNITVHDEGVYKCFYYSMPFKRKMTTVKVLAAPSKPVLQASRDTEGSVTLSCYIQGCKPQAQVTWLLDNGTQLPGDTRHKLEADGKKWTTTSTLTVLAYGPNSTASCLVHHKALQGGKLTVPFHFEDIPETVANTTPAQTTLEVDTNVSENVQPTVTTAESDLNSNTDFSPSYPQHNGPGATSPAAGEPSGTSARHIPNDTETAPNGTVTEELFRTEASFPSENVTLISIVTFEQDVKSEGMSKKEKHFLLPLLVAVLIVLLLIIVALFTKKLIKARGVWKRENETSDQTLESYKSKSNEESQGHEKNGQVVNQKSNTQYVTEGYMESIQKDPSEKKTVIPEEQLACGKETDV